MVFIAWNSPRSLNASHTILSLAAFWIKSTFICANVLCHHNGLAFTCTCVPKFFKDTFSLFTSWSCATPTSVATSPINVLRRRIISHELAVPFDNHWASCSHMQWPSTLHQHSANAKSLALVYTSKGLSNSVNLTTGGEDHLLLSSQRLGDKAHPTLGIAIFPNKSGKILATLEKILNEVVIVVG